MPTNVTFAAISGLTAEQIEVTTQPGTGFVSLNLGGEVYAFIGDTTQSTAEQLNEAIALGEMIAGQASQLRFLHRQSEQADLARAARKEAAAERADEHDEIGRVA